MTTPTAVEHPSRAVTLVRKLLPTGLYTALRSVFMALFSPTGYAMKRGYLRSALTRRVTGRDGQPTPWMTFPLIDFLEQKSFTERTVLEFGSGASTAWWGQRARHVLALETDSSWIDSVRAMTSDNVEVVGVSAEPPTQLEFDREVRTATAGQRFDVVVVDGGDRVKALVLAPELVTEDGFILVDDLDLFDDHPDWRAAIAPWAEQGFQRVDFIGLAIGAPYSRDKRCTSMFVRPGSFVTALRQS